MDKILTISYTDGELYRNIYIRDERIDYVVLCVHFNLVWRCFYRAIMQLGLGGLLLRYRLKGRNLQDYRLIIINEMISPVQLIKYIGKMVNSNNIIYWLWNPIKKAHETTRFYNYKKEIKALVNLHARGYLCVTSFDLGDCREYGFAYHPQVVPNFSLSYKSRQISQDIFFAGKDKGRIKKILELVQVFESEKITYKLWILPDKRKYYTKNEKKFILNTSYISYQQIVEQDLKSKAILDIVQQDQMGLTWRPIEAVLYQKKLITNFRQIKDYDFYEAENVFILGEQPIENLHKFINTPYKKNNADISKYTFSGWLNTVLSRKDVNES